MTNQPARLRIAIISLLFAALAGLAACTPGAGASAVPSAEVPSVAPLASEAPSVYSAPSASMAPPASTAPGSSTKGDY